MSFAVRMTISIGLVCAFVTTCWVFVGAGLAVIVAAFFGAVLGAAYSDHVHAQTAASPAPGHTPVQS